MSMYVIDDHPLLRQAIGMLLRRLRPAAKVVELEKYSELQAAIIKNGEPELFVLDLLLPGVKGATAVSDIKGMYNEVPLVVLSAMPAGEAVGADAEHAQVEDAVIRERDDPVNGPHPAALAVAETHVLRPWQRVIL